MSSYELVSLVIAFITITISILSLYFSTTANNKANKLNGYYNSLVERNNQFVSGQTELQLIQTIDETRRHVMNITYRLTELPTDAEEKVKKLLYDLLNSAIESNVNAYENACSLYIDDKIDKERFKKNYFSEIKNIIEDESHKDFYHPEATSKYWATWKVYKEWNILE